MKTAGSTQMNEGGPHRVLNDAGAPTEWVTHGEGMRLKDMAKVEKQIQEDGRLQEK